MRCKGDRIDKMMSKKKDGQTVERTASQQASECRDNQSGVSGQSQSHRALISDPNPVLLPHIATVVYSCLGALQPYEEIFDT